MVILDTDHMSLLERTESTAGARLRSRLEPFAAGEWATTIISYEEQTRGWLGVLPQARSMSRQIEAYARLNKQLDHYRGITVLDFEERAATEYQRLRQARLRIGAMDLKIAAIVLARGAILLSRNRSHFGQVPGLQVEDWTV